MWQKLQRLDHFYALLRHVTPPGCKKAKRILLSSTRLLTVKCVMKTATQGNSRLRITLASVGTSLTLVQVWGRRLTPITGVCRCIPPRRRLTHLTGVSRCAPLIWKLNCRIFLFGLQFKKGASGPLHRLKRGRPDWHIPAVAHRVAPPWVCLPSVLCVRAPHRQSRSRPDWHLPAVAYWVVRTVAMPTICFENSSDEQRGLNQSAPAKFRGFAAYLRNRKLPDPPPPKLVGFILSPPNSARSGGSDISMQLAAADSVSPDGLDSACGPSVGDSATTGLEHAQDGMPPSGLDPICPEEDDHSTTRQLHLFRCRTARRSSSGRVPGKAPPPLLFPLRGTRKLEKKGDGGHRNSCRECRSHRNRTVKQVADFREVCDRMYKLSASSAVVSVVECEETHFQELGMAGIGRYWPSLQPAVTDSYGPGIKCTRCGATVGQSWKQFKNLGRMCETCRPGATACKTRSQ